MHLSAHAHCDAVVAAAGSDEIPARRPLYNANCSRLQLHRGLGRWETAAEQGDSATRDLEYDGLRGVEAQSNEVHAEGVRR